jgi:hypothetical protein
MGKLKWIIGAAAALGGAGWLGLKVPPKLYDTPDDPGRDLGTLAMPDDLPAPVTRCYRAIALFPRVETAYAHGRGKIALGSKPFKVWLPLRWQSWVEPGRQFRWDAESTWFGLKLFGGGDEIVGGEARFAMGPMAQTGDAIFKAEHPILWFYTLWFCPSALLAMPGIRWEAVDDVTACLHFPPMNGQETRPFILHFDPASSALVRISTERFQDQTGEYVPYQGTMGVRRSFGGTSLSVTAGAAWGDDFYVHLTLEHARYNIELPFAREEVSRA